MPAPLPCLVISDGRRGIENQALGLAEALGRIKPLKLTNKTLDLPRVFKALPPYSQLLLKPRPSQYGLGHITARLVIGCGRQAIAPLLALKKQHGEQMFTIYIQNPRLDPASFDLVIAPQHDRLDAPNALSMIGSPNRLTPDALKNAAQQMASELTPLPAPRIAVLIGGNSKTRKLDNPTHNRHLSALRGLLAQGAALLITTSRRTPEFANADYRRISQDRPNIIFYDGHNPTGENPYLAFLGMADAILVTEDSTNMLVEACTTGKPVFRLEMAGNPGKFTHLYQALERRCHVRPFHVRPFDGNLTAPYYAPLAETDKIARQALEFMKERSILA